ncbi:hypothetical protein ABZ935_03290 [Streptomyces coeruleorubidus]|uniref:hypothetical protein n=1 Tax=Streptomyces coeruleorubidus TaxID=116188 RepID=UPI0033F22A2A
MRDVIAIENLTYRGEEQALDCLLQSHRGVAPHLEFRTAREWFFRLAAYLTPGATRDPDLSRVASEVFGCATPQIPKWCILEEREDSPVFACSFNHSWALWAWSKWLAKRNNADQLGNRRPMIVHLDSHDDLAAPPLRFTARRSQFEAAFDGLIVDLKRPASISAAIDLGLVGIGSFIVPFLHGLTGFEFVHLCMDTSDQTQSQGSLSLGSRESGEVMKRPELLIADGSPGRKQGGRELGTYKFGPDFSILGILEPAGPVLLDIDMDFFCNRYDDSMEGRNRCVTDNCHTRESICDLIDELGFHLRSNRGLCNQVEVVTIALSPGFFPSEFSKVTLAYLRDTLAAVLNKGDGSSPTSS